MHFLCERYAFKKFETCTFNGRLKVKLDRGVPPEYRTLLKDCYILIGLFCEVLAERASLE